MAQLPPPTATTYKLDKECELRVEAGAKGITYLRLGRIDAAVSGGMTACVRGGVVSVLLRAGKGEARVAV